MFQMEKKYGKYVVFASQTGAKLDSDVHLGGGTDDTEILQAVLDTAPQNGGLHLIMDGAALVTGLIIHSNTTIECLNKSCGFYLADNANSSLLRNANLSYSDRIDHNITLIGGTYNENCRGQIVDLWKHQEPVLGNYEHGWVIAFRFYGVEHLTIKDITIRNQRTWSASIINFYRVVIENVNIELPGKMQCWNQDGFHFCGPGQFLTIKNLKGDAGDDLIALAPDEHDHKSSITDVLIDGVQVDNADQVIRMLSRGTGRLDRVIIKNITGTYRSFGFYICPWFKSGLGNFGNIIIDTVDLRQTPPNYDYTTPFLFRIGGSIESLTLRNIYHMNPIDNRPIAEVGISYEMQTEGFATSSKIRSLVIDGVQIVESNPDSSDASYITVRCPVENLIIQNARINRSDEMARQGCFVEILEEADVKVLIMNNICANRMDRVLKMSGGNVSELHTTNVFCRDMSNQ